MFRRLALLGGVLTLVFLGAAPPAWGFHKKRYGAPVFISGGVPASSVGPVFMGGGISSASLTYPGFVGATNLVYPGAVGTSLVMPNAAGLYYNGTGIVASSTTDANATSARSLLYLALLRGLIGGQPPGGGTPGTPPGDTSNFVTRPEFSRLQSKVDDLDDDITTLTRAVQELRTEVEKLHKDPKPQFKIELPKERMLGGGSTPAPRTKPGGAGAAGATDPDGVAAAGASGGTGSAPVVRVIAVPEEDFVVVWAKMKLKEGLPTGTLNTLALEFSKAGVAFAKVKEDPTVSDARKRELYQAYLNAALAFVEGT